MTVIFFLAEKREVPPHTHWSTSQQLFGRVLMYCCAESLRQARAHTHTHICAQIFLLGLNINFHSFVQSNPNPNQFMPKPNLNLISIHILLIKLKQDLTNQVKPHQDWSLVPMRTVGPHLVRKGPKQLTKTSTHTHTYTHTHTQTHIKMLQQ